MSEKDREKFVIWNENQKNEIFNLHIELLEYCKSDVDILAKGCLAFRFLFMEMTKTDIEDSGIDPFLQCITLPSACHYVFRRNFMEPKSIGLIPPYGYSSEPSSYKSIIWLKYESKQSQVNIQHSRNGKEKRIDKYRVDGWVEETATVYEFHGCLFHGCPEPISETFRKHTIRMINIRNCKEVKHLVEIWECAYEKKI